MVCGLGTFNGSIRENQRVESLRSKVSPKKKADSHDSCVNV